jgi:hypothetical protein
MPEVDDWQGAHKADYTSPTETEFDLLASQLDELIDQDYRSPSSSQCSHTLTQDELTSFKSQTPPLKRDSSLEELNAHFEELSAQVQDNALLRAILTSQGLEAFYSQDYSSELSSVSMSPTCWTKEQKEYPAHASPWPVVRFYTRTR